MLDRLEKLAPYLVILLFGHLTYSTTVEQGVRAVKANDMPVIGKKLLQPDLTEAQPGASPVGRDPFDVAWASYRNRPVLPKHPASRPTSRPATSPATAPASRPAVAEPPPLPKRLTAVIMAEKCPMAIIDEAICKPGMLIGGSDPEHAWRVEAIEPSQVTLVFGDTQRVLRIAEDAPPSKRPATADKRRPRP